MMRYFIEASYLGTNYAGWQRQPSDPTIQQTLEEAFSLILREEIQITGCGRTDAGVHAQQYYFHFDTEQTFTANLLRRFNKYIPADIGLRTVYLVPSDVSARFSAVRRTYRYVLKFSKDPFSEGTALWYPYSDTLDKESMEQVAQLLLQYDTFKPFCKEGSDAKHYRCQLFESSWTFSEKDAVFTISANRFLRGMVRLIVGACIQAGRGKISLDDIKSAMQDQTSLQYAESIAAHGLHLVGVEYPEDVLSKRIV
jgi:tRNA pseudouridine38-40 synthase